MGRTYDLVNLVSSFGFSAFWRRQCVANLPITPGACVCDMMAGTGECWSHILRRGANHAVTAFQSAIATPGFNGVGHAWYNLGQALQAKGDLDEAVKAYRQALDTAGYDHPAYAWHALGYALQSRGELDQAIEAYRQAINTPGYAHVGRAWYDVGTALQAKGNLDQAIEIYRKALDMPGSDYRICAWLKLGMAFHTKGDLDQALKAWKKATEAPGSDDPAQSDDNSRPLAPFNMENFEVPTNLLGAEGRKGGISSPSFSMAAARSSGPMPDGSLNSFIPRAQQVLALAREEAVRLNHYFAGTEHVLLGLISLGQGVAVNVLAKLGINLANVRKTVEKGVGAGPDQRVTRNPTFTPRVKKAMALAVKEAQTMNHAYVGTEHILLGLLREGDGVAARVLKDLGVDIEKTRLEILKDLDPNSGSPGDQGQAH